MKGMQEHQISLKITDDQAPDSRPEQESCSVGSLGISRLSGDGHTSLRPAKDEPFPGLLRRQVVIR